MLTGVFQAFCNINPLMHNSSIKGQLCSDIYEIRYKGKSSTFSRQQDKNNTSVHIHNDMHKSTTNHDPRFTDITFPFLPQNRFILEGTLEIHKDGQNARFGTSLAPVPDLNGDGFNDLVVGAPLEDEHKGAIYVFFCQQNRIIRKYKQVGAVMKVQLKG